MDPNNLYLESLPKPSTNISLPPFFNLVPARRSTKYESQTTTAMDELVTKFDGFEAAMTKMLDKLTGMEAWKSSMDAMVDKLLTYTTTTVARLHHLESAHPIAPHLPPRPSTAPPPSPPRWTNPFDLNVAPHRELRPSALSL